MPCSNLHVHRHPLRPCVERPSEDPRKPENVVHLVQHVAPPRTHHLRPALERFVRQDLRVRVGHRQHYGILVHVSDVVGVQQVLRRKPDEHVRALDNVVDRAALHIVVRRLGDPLLHRVQVVPTLVYRPPGVDQHYVRRPHLLQNLRAGYAAGPCPAEHHLHLVETLAYHLQRIDRRRQRHHRRPVLVVVEHRYSDVHQVLFYVKTPRCRDVLQVDPPERRSQVPHDHDYLVRVLGRDAYGPRIDPRKLPEQHRLPLHHRHRTLRPDVPQPQHRRPIAHHGNHVAFVGQFVGLRLVRLYIKADLCNARGVRQGHVLHRLQRHLRIHAYLAASLPVHLDGHLAVVHWLGLPFFSRSFVVCGLA